MVWFKDDCTSVLIFPLVISVISCVDIVVGEDHTSIKYSEPHTTAKHKQEPNNAPLEFPKHTDSSTPILNGNDPTHSNLPPHVFPKGPVPLGTETNITYLKLNNEAKLNTTHENTASDGTNSTVPTRPNQHVSEQDDMLHSRYTGGEDVDELKKPQKKALEKSEKIPTTLKAEIYVNPLMDNKGPKPMNATITKLRESMLESPSTVMAVSSSVLANRTLNIHTISEPAQTVESVLLSLAVVLSFGVAGVFVWNRITKRRFGRDVLINEEDFDEISDMHSFDRAQVQIT